MKWIFILFACFFCIPSFAGELLFSKCPQALPPYDAKFCASFKSVAECHCIEKGLPKPQCQDMNNVYQLMLLMYKTMENACEKQHDTSKQTCIDDWNCYRKGGKDSQGRLCSSTGKVCK